MQAALLVVSVLPINRQLLEIVALNNKTKPITLHIDAVERKKKRNHFYSKLIFLKANSNVENRIDERKIT